MIGMGSIGRHRMPRKGALVGLHSGMDKQTDSIRETGVKTPLHKLLPSARVSEKLNH